MFDQLLAEDLKSFDHSLFGGGSGEALQQGNGIAAGPTNQRGVLPAGYLRVMSFTCPKPAARPW